MKEIKQEKISSDMENFEVKKEVDEDFLLTYEKMPKAKLKEEPKESPKNTFHNKKLSVKCEKCQRNFTSKGTLKIHRCIDALTCSECKKVFKNVNCLKKHLRSIHDIEMYADDGVLCKYCDNFFKDKGHLLIHIRKCAIKSKRNQKFCCDYCGKEFGTKGALSQHILTHTVKRVECKICHSKVREINVHMAKFHPTKEGIFKCQECSKVYQTQLLLDIHLKTHNKKFACKICGRKFQCKKYLEDHVKLHENPEEFRCKICSQTLINAWNLMMHLKTHEMDREKKFECNQCDFKTHSVESIKGHKKSHEKLELKLKKQPDAVKCNLCHKVLKNKDSYSQHKLRQHKRKTMNRKFFHCDFCEYKTDVKQNMKSHFFRMHVKKQ